MIWDARHPLELLSPWVVLVGTDERAVLSNGDLVMREWTDPLEALRWMRSSWSDGMIPIHGSSPATTINVLNTTEGANPSASAA